MTEHDQRIAIAEWMGWAKKGDPYPNSTNGEEVQWWVLSEYGPERTTETLPDFCHDLNAIHEAEARLPRYEQSRYHLALTLECTGYALPEFMYMTISATAAQRCEALLRTLDLWRDDLPTPISSAPSQAAGGPQ